MNDRDLSIIQAALREAQLQMLSPRIAQLIFGDVKGELPTREELDDLRIRLRMSADPEEEP